MTVVKEGKAKRLEEPRSISPELQKLIEEESKLVKGRFKNYDVPGGPLVFNSRKYPGQEVFKKTFMDGGVYEIPLWVARHLNGVDVTAKELDGKLGTCSYPVHGFKWDPGQNAPANQVGPAGEILPTTISKRVQRYGFQSLEFDVGE